MAYDDHEIRVGAVVLVPSSICPRPSSTASIPIRAADMQRQLSRNVSAFSSSAALFEKLKKEERLRQTNVSGVSTGTAPKNENSLNNVPSTLNKLASTYSRYYSIKYTDPAIADEKTKEQIISLGLSSCQISLLLSSIWAQSLSPLNKPENYEAIAHTYSLVLLYARTKNSSNDILVRSFQLAFSLRRFSVNGGGSLSPSHRRCLFTLAISMIIFSAKAYNIPAVVSWAKAAITDKTADPFLQLVEDAKLEAVDTQMSNRGKVFGSKEDEENALKSFVSMATKIVEEYSIDSTMRQLLGDFTPDDICPLGADLFMGK